MGLKVKVKQNEVEKDINDSLLYSYHLSCRINDITFK